MLALDKKFGGFKDTLALLGILSPFFATTPFLNSVPLILTGISSVLGALWLWYRHADTYLRQFTFVHCRTGSL